jgi:PAS domain S-box-containing protein
VKLRSQLVFLTLVALMPVAILAILLGAFLIQQQRDTFRRGAEERTLALLTAVDAELRGSIDAVVTLSQAASLDEGDVQLFGRTATRVLKSHPQWININLAMPDRQRVLDLLAAEGAPLPPITDDGEISELLQTRKPVIANLAPGPVSNRWNFAVRVPVIRDGTVTHILSAVVRPEPLTELVAAQNLPERWAAVVLDRNNRIVAGTLDPEKSRGQLASQSLRDALARAPSGWFRGTTIEGVEVYTPYRTSQASGWTFAMAIPTQVVDATATRAIWIFGLTLAGVIVLAFGLARLVGRRIAEPIAALAAATDRLANGESVTIKESSRLGELRSLETALRNAAGGQAALRRAEEQTRSIVNHVLDGIITIDERGTIESFNRAAEKLFGYNAPEVIGKNVKLLMPEPYRAGHDGFIGNYLRTGQAKIIGVGREVVGQRKDGSTFPMDLAVSEFRLDEKRYFTGIVRDITERKSAEQELRDADRHKDEFLAMLSHELRNPLAALTTAAHVLRVAAPEDPTSAGAQGVIDRQTQHMVRLIEDLLDITRVRLGKLSLKREPVNLGDLVSEVTQSKRKAVGLSGRAAVKVDASSVWVDGDRARLEQIYLNLLDNALKFTPASGAIQVSVRQDGPEAVLSVADNGKGIRAEVLPAIFELFVQGEQNLGRTQGGLGLGLALVRRLAELHGGKASAASGGVGQGATFTVSLPAIAAPSKLRRPGAPRRRLAKPKPLKVLVVEDSQDARQMLRAGLAMQGHDVHEAASGAAALAAAAEVHPEVVLLDIGLPDIDGYEVAQRLRAEAGGRSIVLVAVSGYGRDEDRGRAREAGFDAHVVKPADAEEIADVIAEIMTRNQVAAT